jgi:hypothetical protein
MIFEHEMFVFVGYLVDLMKKMIFNITSNNGSFLRNDVEHNQGFRKDDHIYYPVPKESQVDVPKIPFSIFTVKIGQSQIDVHARLFGQSISDDIEIILDLAER